MPSNLRYTTHAITLDDYPVYSPKHLADGLMAVDRPITKFWGKANSFVLPRGREHGRGWVLMLHKDLKQLNSTWGGFSHTLRFHDDYASGVAIKSLAIARAEALTGFEQKNPDEVMYLVELVDARSVARFSAIDKSYNVRTYQYLTTTNGPDYYTHSLNSGAVWTWGEILMDLWNELPSPMTVPVVTSNWPSSDPQNYTFRGMNAWDAVNKLLDDTGHTVYRDLDGNWFVAPKGATQNIANLESQLRLTGLSRDNTWDYPNVVESIRIPASVRVFFHAAYHAFQNVSTDAADRVVTGKDAWVSQPLYSVDYTSNTYYSGLNTVAGTVAALHDSLCAYYDEEGVLVNGAELDARAVTIAENYLAALQYRDDCSLHSVYLGYRPEFTAGSEVSAVWWFEIGSGSRTEVLLSPLHYLPEDIPNKLGSHNVADALAWESVAPPDLGRAWEPTDRWALVEPLDEIDKEDVGDARVMYGTHAGGGPITWEDSGKVIALHNPWPVPLPAEKKILAFWHLQTRRWIAAPPRKGALFTGTLYADMCPSDTGMPVGSVLRDADSCEDVDVPEVLNPYELAGKAFDKFVAFWDCNADEGNGAYVVLQVQHHEEEYVRADFTNVAGCTEELDEEGNPTGRTVPTYECKVKYSKRKISVMWCNDPQVDLTLISAELTNVLIDVWQEGLNIVGRFHPVYVLCPCDYYDDVLLVGTDCGSGSGSSSGGQ